MHALCLKVFFEQFRGLTYNICFSVRCSVVMFNYCLNISPGSTYNICLTVR